MPRELKVYALGGFARESDGFTEDELGHHRQITMIVATRTKKRAQELFGCTSTEMRDYSAVTGNEFDCATALRQPEQVFARPLMTNKANAPYRPIYREPHVPIPRRKKKPFVPAPAPVNFTADELQMIADRFAMSNDPDGQTIAEKAEKMLKRIGRSNNHEHAGNG